MRNVNIDFAPIVVFAFNRLDSLKSTIDSLSKNYEAKESELFVFDYGSRKNNEGECIKVKEVRDFVKTITGFKKTSYTFSDTNKGLAMSIITGVTDVINKFGRVIVLEDDLYVQQNFLSYMNQMLVKYESNDKIFQITGFGIKVKLPTDYPYDIYFHYRAHSWSWATWKDRWVTVDWDVKTYNTIANSSKLQKYFNRGGSDLFGMLKHFKKGTLNSWYIRFNYEMFIQDKLCVCPVDSLIRNEGFGKTATHCVGYNRYKINIGDHKKKQFICPPNILVNKFI